MGEFKNIDLLPSRILLCGGGSNLPDIERILKGASWGKKLPFARKPSVHFLVPSEIPNVIDTTKKLTTIQDITPMALANLAIDLVGRAKASDAVVSRVVKSLKS